MEQLNTLGKIVAALIMAVIIGAIGKWYVTTPVSTVDTTGAGAVNVTGGAGGRVNSTGAGSVNAMGVAAVKIKTAGAGSVTAKDVIGTLEVDNTGAGAVTATSAVTWCGIPVDGSTSMRNK